MPAVAVSVGGPGFFGRGGGGVRGGGVLGEVGSPGVLNLRGVDHVLAVVAQLDVGLGTGPFAVSGGVASAVGEGCGGVSKGGVGPSVGERSVRGSGVRGGVRGNVRGFKVGNLGGVDHTAVMG